jgi:hypothetical protein
MNVRTAIERVLGYDDGRGHDADHHHARRHFVDVAALAVVATWDLRRRKCRIADLRRRKGITEISVS